jgi:acyl-CoA reductase-like NAD-dependent aldehyde dehydrogenase
MSFGTTLGSIGIAVDSWPRTSTPKLASVGNDPEQRFYLLATYCFDAARKLEYVYKATRRYALEADPALAAEIKQDNEALSAARKDWKQSAETAERILLRLLEETAEDHEKILNLLVRPRR